MQKEKPTTKQSETVGTFSSHAETEVFLSHKLSYPASIEER